MNGFELLAAMRADDSLKHVPVLMVAAEARDAEVARCRESAATKLTAWRRR